MYLAKINGKQNVNIFLIKKFNYYNKLLIKFVCYCLK